MTLPQPYVLYAEKEVQMWNYQKEKVPELKIMIIPIQIIILLPFAPMIKNVFLENREN